MTSSYIYAQALILQAINGPCMQGYNYYTAEGFDVGSWLIKIIMVVYNSLQ